MTNQKQTTEQLIKETEKKLEELKAELKQEQSKNIEVEWLKIPELKIEVEIQVHDKNKSWNELKLSERESELLTVEQCIFLANSKYAEELKMDGSSSKDDFFIKQPFNLNKKNNYVARFFAGSDWANLLCDRHPAYSLPSLGVRFCRKLRRLK